MGSDNHWNRKSGLARGTISASELIGSRLRSSRPSTLTRAIGELGRVAKTLYLLSYLDDETYRRRILTQLNRGESRQGVARAIFHGQRGEVRQRYREGQEDQLGALGLVVNVVVLWNTLYMDAALAHLRRQEVETKLVGLPLFHHPGLRTPQRNHAGSPSCTISPSAVTRTYVIWTRP